MFDYIIVDDWYSDPDRIRTFGISQFSKSTKDGESRVDENGYGLFPGHRSKSNISNLIENKDKIEKYTGCSIDPEKWIYANTCDFKDETQLLEFDFSSLTVNTMGMRVRGSDVSLNIKDSLSNGCFQYCPETSTKWIHSDSLNTYAAVVYLNPDADKHSGTGFYRHKETGKESEKDPGIVLPKEECIDFDKWELVNYVENIYNRCIIFDAKKYHSATKYFGTTLENSRFTQVFFFDLKESK